VRVCHHYVWCAVFSV